MPARPSRARRLGRGEPDWSPPSPSRGLKTYAQPTPKQRPSTSQTKAHNQPLLRAVLDGQKISLSIYGAVKTAGGGSWNSLSAPGTPAPACPTRPSMCQVRKGDAQDWPGTSDFWAPQNKYSYQSWRFPACPHRLRADIPTGPAVQAPAQQQDPGK